MADPAKPLGPLDPQIVAHLNSNLGPAQPFLLRIRGGLDIKVDAWVIGRADMINGNRGTTVEIRITPAGSLLTTHHSWSKDPESRRSDKVEGQAHATAADALQWLLANGKGELATTSKLAWMAACGTCPPMAGLDVQRIA